MNLAEYGSDGADFLHEALLPLTNIERCTQPALLGADRWDPLSGALDENMFCAGQESGGIDTCQVRVVTSQMRVVISQDG